MPADEALCQALVFDNPPEGALAVEVDLGAQGRKATLELPALLPRLTELASSGDRQTRVLAAECFHAAVLNLVGDANKKGGAGRL